MKIKTFFVYLWPTFYTHNSSLVQYKNVNKYSWATAVNVTIDKNSVTLKSDLDVQKYLSSEGKVAIHYCLVFLCLIDMFNLYVLLKIIFQSVNKSFLQNRERKKFLSKRVENSNFSVFNFCETKSH